MCGTWTKAIAPLVKDLSSGTVTQRESAALATFNSSYLLPLPSRCGHAFSSRCSLLRCTTFQRILARLHSFFSYWGLIYRCFSEIYSSLIKHLLDFTFHLRCHEPRWSYSTYPHPQKYLHWWQRTWGGRLPLACSTLTHPHGNPSYCPSHQGSKFRLLCFLLSVCFYPLNHLPFCSSPLFKEIRHLTCRLPWQCQWCKNCTKHADIYVYLKFGFWRRHWLVSSAGMVSTFTESECGWYSSHGCYSLHFWHQNHSQYY